MLTGLFLAALAFNVYGVTYHWTVPFMSGHEFRQTQTAITSYYIDQDNNFSLLYETPLLGKPWVSILLEVPIYEWSVVLVHRATDWPLVEAARAVTAACFYLTLPAIFLLLGRFGLSRYRRLLVLALILVCPVYIYYSRAFLMDAMELMCCAWFALGFVRTMDERRWSWFALAVVAGVLAALIKSAILAAWLVPTAAYGAWMLWRDLRASGGWRPPVKTLLWGLGTVVPAFGALRWWIHYTDPIKAAHASAWIFTSKNLSEGNWGLFDFRSLFSGQVWHYLLTCWREAIMPPWLIGLGLAAGALLPAVRWRVLGFGAVFLVAQCMFPFAYAYQDYYFYSCALFLNVAFGFLLIGVLDRWWPRWGCALLLAVPLVVQGATYWRGYREGQSVVSRGGLPFDYALREITPANSVIIVAGADWAAMTPYYAQRRALMIRNGLEYDPEYLERAFNDLAGEDVSALVLYGQTRTNRRLIKLAAAKFDFDPNTPTFTDPQADVYMSRLYLKGAQMLLKTSRSFPSLKPVAAANFDPFKEGLIKLSPASARSAFTMVSPAPYVVNFRFGVSWLPYENQAVLSAHPNSDLWLHPPASATVIHWVYGIFPSAYEHPGKQTDGVEFVIRGEAEDGKGRVIYDRVLDPAKNPADRGTQRITVSYTPRPGESLRFSTRPNKGDAFDWAYWVQIKVD